MGYGGAKGAIAEKTSGSGDEGFDGIVNENVGLDKIYLQAKRYGKDKTTDVSTICWCACWQRCLKGCLYHDKFFFIPEQLILPKRYLKDRF